MQFCFFQDIKLAFFLHHTNALLRAAYPGLLWQMPPGRQVLYLTFDDGPIPEVTPWVLDQLAQYQARATFFCIGDNVRKHPEILRQVLHEGHSVGNHTFNHLNGWKTPAAAYVQNAAECSHWLPPTRLFRPPYGRISRRQIQAMRPAHDLVMWSVLSGDFSASLSSDAVLKATLKHTSAGSIVVFHDSLKARRHLEYALPRCLAYWQAAGYGFRGLPMHGLS